MNNLKFTFRFILISIIALYFSDINAQYIPRLERGDDKSQRYSTMDANQVKVSIHNNGVHGKQSNNPNEFMFEWPKNSGRGYIYFISPMVGAEVIDEEGNKRHIVSIGYNHTGPDGDPWNFLPVPEYLNINSTQIARSDDPASWPDIWIDKLDDPDDPGWPGAWNSFWGKDYFTADQEFYYHTSDDMYDMNRFEYYPDSTDLNRRGLGLIISQRVLEFDLFPDEVFFISDIYNAGTEDLDTASYTSWIADIVGGDADDDLNYFNFNDNVIYFCDGDGIGTDAFFGDTVRTAALIFLQTPLADLDDPLSQAGITSAIRDPSFSFDLQPVDDEKLEKVYDARQILSASKSR